jgi:hypothetical protein
MPPDYGENVAACVATSADAQRARGQFDAHGRGCENVTSFDIASGDPRPPRDVLVPLPMRGGEGANGTARPRPSSFFLHHKHALAGGLRVEQAIGFFRLFELPLVREQAVDIDLALDDKTGAIGLALP